MLTWCSCLGIANRPSRILCNVAVPWPVPQEPVIRTDLLIPFCLVRSEAPSERIHCTVLSVPGPSLGTISWIKQTKRQPVALGAEEAQWRFLSLSTIKVTWPRRYEKVENYAIVKKHEKSQIGTWINNYASEKQVTEEVSMCYITSAWFLLD